MRGSSPRVWGQVAKLLCDFGIMRIIPTRVGTRQQRHNSRHRRTDHPHACGDKIGGTASGYFNLGSSPRVWGQDELKNGEFSYMRIIPTRVGTRAGQEQVQHELRDHPHACGDKATYQDRHGDWHGSSPRVWGQDHRFRCYAVTYRIIPTRVGTSRYRFRC